MKVKPKKLLLITKNKYPPFWGDIVVLFCKKFPENGFSVDLVMENFNSSSQNFVTNFLNSTIYVRKGSKNIFQKILSIFSNCFFVFRLSLKNKYDVILVRDKIITSLFFIFVSKICRSKFVFWLSFPFPEAQIFHFTMTRNLNSLIRGLLRWIILYKFILLNSDLILVRSEEMKK